MLNRVRPTQREFTIKVIRQGKREPIFIDHFTGTLAAAERRLAATWGHGAVQQGTGYKAILYQHTEEGTVPLRQLGD